MIIGDQKEMKIPDYKPQRQYEAKKFEHGAHFEYISLFKSLMDLMPTLPLNRLGNKGVYFQEEEKRQLTNNIIYYNRSK